MSELKIAVVGCGGMGAVHLNRWTGVPGARIAAVCDADATLAYRVATEFGAEAHTDWEALIGDGGLDVVDICTPPNLHEAIAVKALRAGAHVLCEKPLARTLQEALRMVEAARECGKLLMPAFCHRFHPPITLARELVENDDLGKVVMFRNRFSGQFTGVEARWFSDPEVAGGGALLDTAVHSIDLFRYLVGEVTQVHGSIATYNPNLRVEDSAIVTLLADTKAMGVVEASWATPGGRNVVEIYGTAGACIVDYDTNRVHYKTADRVAWETKELEGPDRFQREIWHFADAVRGVQPLLVTGEDGLRANEIIQAVYDQALTSA
ncbi:MAG: Gfo/Idh/MocA family protein [Chthonomonadales bacterium]